MGGSVIFLFIMVPVSLLFTGLGIYAWRRKKPMWFWSGSTVPEEEISDIPAYNRANGLMWLSFSLVFWLSAVLGGAVGGLAGGIALIAGVVVLGPLLPVIYSKIYQKYRK